MKRQPPVKGGYQAAHRTADEMRCPPSSVSRDDHDLIRATPRRLRHKAPAIVYRFLGIEALAGVEHRTAVRTGQRVGADLMQRR